MNCEGGILNENRLERDIVTDGDKINERKTKIRQAKKMSCALLRNKDVLTFGASPQVGRYAEMLQCQ